MINNIHSIHALVRLLKSPTDPPSPQGPSKIDIAWLAWSDSTFHAANKGEVIGEWIFTLLGQGKKTKREESISDPATDSRYWSLLCSVLTSPPSATARPVKTWILPLLNRFQLGAVVIKLLALQSPRVLAPARSALTVIWPLAEKKVSVDALGECLNAVFDACVRWESVDDDLAWICSAAVGAYRNALANAGNKKKLYGSFLSTHLFPWLSVVSVDRSPAGPTKQLQGNIYVAGIETLFCLDALKQPLDALFDALSSPLSPISSLLPLLPKLFTSFLNAMQRHRSTLFVAATNTTSGKEESRKMGMQFTERCWILIQGFADLQEGFNVDKWRSIIGIFSVVEKERLFVPYPIRGTRIGVADGCGEELALSEARDKAIEILEHTSTLFKEQMFVSMQLLDVLVRIDYDFIESVLERILSAFANIPPTLFHLTTIQSSEFLTHVLEYHTKTRTLHTYVLVLLRAVVASSTSLTSRSYVPPTTLGFPLVGHLPALGRALRTSLTPTQAMPLAVAVLQAVETAWKVFKDAHHREGVTIKQRITRDRVKSELGGSLVPAQARAFSFTSRVAGMVLSNLPSNAYIEDGDDSLKSLWGDAGKLGWTIFWDCLEEGTEGVRRHQDKGGHDKKRKLAVEADSFRAHHLPIVASAVLRFLYDVRDRVSSPLGECDRLGEPDVGTLLNIVRDGASEPELVVETIRTLFWHMWYTHDRGCERRIEAQPIFAVTLDILSTRISLKSKWSGMLADLTPDNLGLAVLHVLTERWIDLLDTLASSENLQSLISLLFSIPPHLLDDDIRNSGEPLQRDCAMITSRAILFKLLQNAQFWELRNIRAVFLSSISILTASLSSQCFPAGEAKSRLPTTAARTELAHASNVYGLLGYVPPEYLARPVRAELIRRAMSADTQICAMLAGADEQGSETKRMDIINCDSEPRRKFTVEPNDNILADDSENWSCRLTFIRAFLLRMSQFLNTTSHTTSLVLVNHLPTSRVSSPSKELTSVTLALINLHLLSLLRSQEPEAATSITSVISAFISAGPFSQPNSQGTWTHAIVQPSVLKLIDQLTSDFDPASLSGEIKRSLTTLVDALESALLPHIQRSMERDSMEPYQLFPSERISAWSRVLSLRRWLGINSQHVSTPFGLRLATSMIRSGAPDIPAIANTKTCPSVLRLLFEELWCIPDISRHAHLDALIGFYVVNSGCWSSDQVEPIDTYVAQASKKLSVIDFSHLLDSIAEGIRGSGFEVGHRERLIHLGKVVLHDAPQGTMRAIQNFVTRCFNSFVDRDEIYNGPSSLKTRCLEFMARYCSDKPVAIRLADLGNIWSFLDKVLGGSSKHDATTVFPVFHYIVTIIGALIRLRRDLVVHTLPHLSLVLRQLIMLTRKIRPQLGAKQSRIVTDTFPSWLSASEPISMDEARALARLLTSLTTKTVPRMHVHGHPSTSTKSQKAESLAKPFAKHASYVLVAYVNAFNDPLCIINAEMRRELEPGLFALCEMVGEHNRDALMVSTLDSGGRTIMKSLWKDYGKQRYVGKG